MLEPSEITRDKHGARLQPCASPGAVARTLWIRQDL